MWKKIKELFADKDKIKRSAKWIAKISEPHKASLTFLLLINLAVTGVGVASAAVNKYIVDLAANSMSIAVYTAVAVAFLVFSLCASVFINIFSVRVTEKYSFHIRSEMYSHILDSVWCERTAIHSESFLSRMTSDASVVSNGVVTVTIEILSTLFNLVAAFLLLWYYDTSMALVAVISGPIAALASLMLGAKLKKIQAEIQQSEADYRQFLQENISHADVIKVFGQEEESKNRLKELQKNRFYWIKMKNRYTVYAGAVISVIFSGTYLFAFITGAVKIGSGLITFGTMTAFLSLIGQVQTPILSLANLIPKGVGILACTDRIMEISDMKTEEKTTEGNVQISTPVGLRAERLTLAYSESNVISGLSFDIKPGQTVMISGGSGIGKTTLLRAILGFLTPVDGSLCLYDANGSEAKCGKDTRPLISYVPQGNTLLSGTIEQNLKMGNSNATESEMETALKAACAWDFVSSLPDGIKTPIGEKAGGISEGQAQRIAIARAFLKPFELLVLDEATSSLDEKTESEILSNLKAVLKGKTCIFVSHRQSVKEYADDVVHISNEL